MTCPCGYYSTCTEGCTPQRIATIRAQQCALGFKDWKEGARLFQLEGQADADRAREEKDWTK